MTILWSWQVPIARKLSRGLDPHIPLLYPVPARLSHLQLPSSAGLFNLCLQAVIFGPHFPDFVET